ncbi:MAG: pyrroline-5-carboxylate reductase [Nitrospirales bacterium]|nr:pyrroline-5-carboxylate reductase [Nitrospirales bacterium]
MDHSIKFGFIGAGNMAEALVSGMLKGGLAEPSAIRVTDVSSFRLRHFQDSFSVGSFPDNRALAQWSHVVVLCVKPQTMDLVLAEIQAKLSSEQFVISVAAGYPIKRIREHVGTDVAIVRAMPNTPAVIRHGVTAIACAPNLDSRQTQLAQHIFESVGNVVMIDESLMDAVTGLSGSGPAYVYLMIEALADAGVRVGLSRSIAHVLATQTVLGAAKMVEVSGEHPATLKDRVTSPGGTTIAGLRELEAGGLRATVMKAVEAATHRSVELGNLPS